MSDTNFTYLTRRDCKEVSIKDIMNITFDIKNILNQYDKEKIKNPLYPNIKFDCHINDECKIITKFEVEITDEAIQEIERLQRTIDSYSKQSKEIEEKQRKLIIQQEIKYKRLQDEYTEEKTKWESDKTNREKEWQMIKEITKKKDYKDIDEELLATQIYKDLRKEYGLDK